MSLQHLDECCLFAIIRMLPAADAGRMMCTSRLHALLVDENQKDPWFVVKRGNGDSLCDVVGQLVGAPTIGVAYTTADSFEATIEGLRRLPPCELIGGCGSIYQTVEPGANDVFIPEEDSEELSLSLCSLPSAHARSFFLPSSTLSDEAMLAETLDSLCASGGAAIRMVILLAAMNAPSDSFDPKEVVEGLQQRLPGCAVVGGVTRCPLLQVQQQVVHQHGAGVVGLLLRGEVPLYAATSRGTNRISPVYTVSKALSFQAGPLHGSLIAELTADGNSNTPYESFVDAMQPLRVRCAPVYYGLKQQGAVGFTLNPITNTSFYAMIGALIVPDEEKDSVQGGEVCFYQLTKDASKADVKATLTSIHDEIQEQNKSLLGAFLFTCNGRGEHMFGEPAADAAVFRSMFPNTPLHGFFAGGEIGPSAMADREGSAFASGDKCTVQGFTAVYAALVVPARNTDGVVSRWESEGLDNPMQLLLAGLRKDAGQPRSERTESHCVWIGRAKRVTAAAGRSHARPACWSACGLQCESNSATEFVSDNVHAPGAIQCPDLLQWKFELVVAKALKFAGVVAPGAWWEECQPWYLTASPSLAQFLW
eukprot:CAMPEP_0204323394 /NCGR_PEP_ID=MMETSP0469-20131031/9371_1 /ASSEMBLY_ACC=CAM_ASM_000384 /TAXON_ID=2969 /ORGANISM="Oxyrrhis marina" /LENGTH=592 /DNA_ID=CAMNT_0051304847 /DNA_START=8 /DNA_END=1784 /DNA_ORIENTATION=+